MCDMSIVYLLFLSIFHNSLRIKTFKFVVEQLVFRFPIMCNYSKCGDIACGYKQLAGCLDDKTPHQHSHALDLVGGQRSTASRSHIWDAKHTMADIEPLIFCPLESITQTSNVFTTSGNFSFPLRCQK